MKSPKPLKNAHTDPKQKGLGDYYGTGFTAKIGKIRDDTMGMAYLAPKQLKKPPKTLA
jgi:hypothetical protein